MAVERDALCAVAIERCDTHEAAVHIHRLSAVCGEDGVLLHTCAFGINFHDVLNVLGEYPGDSRRPDTDAAGFVAEFETSASLAVDDAASGLGHAPLACITCSIATLLTIKRAALSFNRVCTLPVT